MLQVTLHFATEQTANFHNRIGWLDIGYEKLAEFADYKAKLFVTGIGELPTIHVQRYPRWSASVWDLVLRVIVQGLYASEEFKLDVPVKRKGAFIDQLFATIEHVADGVDGRRSHVGTASLVMRRTRCNYVATVEDDFCGSKESEVFRHTPDRLMHWDLFARGIAMALTGRQEMPSRPPLSLPATFVDTDEKKYVPLSRLSEPARSAFPRWLAKKGVEPTMHPSSLRGLVPEGLYVEFLRTAI